MRLLKNKLKKILGTYTKTNIGAEKPKKQPETSISKPRMKRISKNLK